MSNFKCQSFKLKLVFALFPFPIHIGRLRRTARMPSTLRPVVYRWSDQLGTWLWENRFSRRVHPSDFSQEVDIHVCSFVIHSFMGCLSFQWLYLNQSCFKMVSRKMNWVTYWSRVLFQQYCAIMSTGTILKVYWRTKADNFYLLLNIYFIYLLFWPLSLCFCAGTGIYMSINSQKVKKKKSYTYIPSK